MIKNRSKRTNEVVGALINGLSGHRVNSITFDNGSEFSSHMIIQSKLLAGTYFCDPGSPWQKGSVENMNGAMRRFLPFTMPAEKITQRMLDEIAYLINNIPKKSLGWRTADEVYGEHCV